MAFHQREEIPLGVAAERGLGEMRVLGKKVFRPAPNVGEVAAPAARNEDLLSGPVGVVDQEDARARAARPWRPP
jgi:hypothetical protein